MRASLLVAIVVAAMSLQIHCGEDARALFNTTMP